MTIPAGGKAVTFIITRNRISAKASTVTRWVSH